MLKLQEYTAWISVDGQPLDTYAVETSLATNEVTCWIPSEAGKEFSVHCQNTSAPGLDTIGAFVYIDGQGCHGSLFERWNVNHTVKFSHAFVSDRITKPFVFSTVRLTDEDEFADVSSADLGQIQVRVCKVVLGEYYDPAQNQLQTEHKVHERSKKAVTHCVGLGKETMIPQTMLRKSQSIGQPLAKFTFKYRDRSLCYVFYSLLRSQHLLVDLLKANGIVPVPAPLKRKASQEIIDLTVNDVQAGSSRSNDPVRGEHNSQRTKETEHRSKKVKQEQKPGVFVEVIDLT
ncbi:uncharacterized protein BJ212DRAFT_906604 [Suillus subaureus]|uniref:DUF7918 domain-containing protein n=1 Tax=Suillus subaureus TaxID=48587 RepID=A0A9P7EGX9_9AGAM|nr:uncharacterized protein BJ212DRAFT_906604 [Suillus subaureus]KAG1821577.1 hypothetical protein BJ212DRAFT_906604 [Suillus subaureus]